MSISDRKSTRLGHGLLSHHVNPPGAEVRLQDERRGREMVQEDQTEVEARLSTCDHSFGVNIILGQDICRSCGETL